VLKVIGKIAGVIALVAGTIATFGIGTAAFAATAGTIAGIAGVVAGVAAFGAQLLYKPPPARGSITQVIVSPDAPTPYVMGEGLVGGVIRHDTAYGATLNKVPNPYRFLAMVCCGAGPVAAITPYADQAAVTSWYNTYLYTTTKLGAQPEGAALVPQFSGAPGWSAASKLSGKAAIGWSLKFDKDGKRFASGVPQLGAYGQWVKVYDPRLDSTRPGGSGSHRVDDEATWSWSESPALHAGTYLYGRWQNGKRVMGVGLPDDGIDWACIAAWANVCDVNDWRIFGAVYEPGDRWGNLRDIALAGGAQPVFSGGVLSFHYAAPRVALDIASDADIAGEDMSVTAMASWRDRINTVVPKYRSPAHNWELVDAEKISVAGYVTEDGEEKTELFPYNLVKDKDQAAQLAAYRLVDGRELQPIKITYGPRMFAFRPGDCLQLDHPELGLDTLAVILTREFDPERMTVTFTFIGETAAKHAYALGLSGVAPATPAIGQTGQERDELAGAAGLPYGWASTIIRNAAAKNPRTTSDVARAMLTASDAGTDATISVARHDWDYPSGTADVTRELGTITGLPFSTYHYVYFDDGTLTDTAPTYGATTVPADAQNSTNYPDRHPLGLIITPADGAADTSGGDNLGYGFNFNFYF
jgi:hypothetical protein